MIKLKKKRILVIQKDFEKIAIKKIKIKIKIKNKFYIWLKGEMKKKNQFNKIIRKIKRMRITIDIKNKNKNKILIERLNWKE